MQVEGGREGGAVAVKEGPATAAAVLRLRDGVWRTADEDALHRHPHS